MTKLATLCLALALTACGCPDVGDVPDAGDAGLPMTDAQVPDDAEPDTGTDAGEDGGLPDAGPPDSGPPPDAWIPEDPDAGGLLDAGEPDSGPPVEPDAGMDAGPPPEPDAGPPPVPDAGVDAGPPDAGPPDSGPPDAGEPDAGTDAGPVCLLDSFEPNDTQATAALLGTSRSGAGAWLPDETTFSGADSDWYRVDVRRTTTRPTLVRASAPAGMLAWFRIRYVCDSGTPTCTGGSRIGNTCEETALGFAELVVACPDLSGNATFYIEATRPSLAACGYSPTFELEPG
jgi:hypothetical protein